MAFVNVAATSVNLQSNAPEGADEKSEQSISSKRKSSSEIVSAAVAREFLQNKSYKRQFKCEDKWWKKTVIYEVYVRSFCDSNNDGVGDLQGIQEKLGYFKELGVNTLWITPMYPSPMVDFGYDISDFKDIDPIFGTMNDFKKLLRAIKDENMKLILDFVPNHTSDRHHWFQKSILQEQPYSDYYVWHSPKEFDTDGKPEPPNNWKSVFGGSAWEYNEQRKQYYLHQFAKEQPDLNFRNPMVIQEMVNVMNFWLELGVDGFRLDAAPHLLEDEQFQDNPPAKIPVDDNLFTENDYCYWNHVYTCNCAGVLDILTTFRNVCDQWSTIDGNERVLMTEGYLPLPELMQYYGTQSNPIAHFSFNFELLGLKKDCSAISVFNCITRWLNALPEHCWPNWQTGNHDQPRIASKLGEEFVDIMNMILLLLPGTAVTYYGEEIGMKNANISWEQTVDPAGRNAGKERFHLFSRDFERTPMQWNSQEHAGFSKSGTPWLPLCVDFPTVNVNSQRAADKSHLKTYKTLVALRTSKACQNGDVDIRVLGNDSVLAFTRVDIVSGESLLVLANFSTTKTLIRIQDFDHVSERVENSVLVVAAVTQSVDEYKEGEILRATEQIKLNGKSGLVCKFSARQA